MIHFGSGFLHIQDIVLVRDVVPVRRGYELILGVRRFSIFSASEG